MIAVFVRLFAYAVLAHEILYLCRDGSDYLTKPFLPVLGLRLSMRAYAAAHMALITVSLALLAFPETPILYALLLIVLTITIASYSLRLSNHFVLAWFFAVLLVIGSLRHSPALVISGVRGLMIATYVLTFLHKLNRDYVTPSQSCAVQWADFFCFDRGIDNAGAKAVIRNALLWGGIAVEGSLPLLLIVPSLAPYGLLLALGFHFAIALLGIVNFSAMMFAGLVVWLPEPTGAPSAGWIAAAIGVSLAAVWILTPRQANFRCPYRYRNAAWVFQTTFGVLAGLLFYGAGAAAVRHLTSATPSPDRAGAVIALFVWSLFVLNGVAPYLGLKTEFSFAMFSNLRDEPWRHLVIAGRWRPFRGSRYVRITDVTGLPESSDGDHVAKLIVHLLSSHDRYRYSPYLLRECVRALAAPELTFTVHDNGRTAPFAEWERRAGRGIRMVLFPFVMPLDSETSHSEQGSVVGQEERQLF